MPVIQFPSPSLFLVMLVIMALTVSSFGQTTNPTSQRPRKVFPAEQDPADVLRFDTDLVSVDVTATDTEGRPVRSLRQQDFKLYSDGTEQPISFFQVERRSGEPRPLAVVFAVDVSGSITEDEIARIREALQAFAGQLSKNSVLYSVMTFGMRVKTIQKLTSDPSKLDESMRRISQDPATALSTHTYDAVDDAIRMLV